MTSARRTATVIALVLFLAGCAPSPAVEAVPTPGSLTVVGLGDSVMSGSNCECAGPVAAYAAKVAPGRSTPVDLSEPGSTAADLRADLVTDRSLRDAVARADVVLVTTGANDVAGSLDPKDGPSCDATCYQPVVDEAGKDIDAALDAIAALRQGRTGTVLVTGYWDAFRSARPGPRR